MIPEEIRAKKGDKVLPKWKKLLDFISKTGIVAGPGVRINRGPNGTYVYADHFQRPWQHPFRCSITTNEATVHAGLVNGLSPFIDGVRISGLDDDGREVNVPPLEIEYLGERRTYIALVMIVSEGDEIGIVETPETFYVDHVVGHQDDPAGGTVAELGRVVYPLAQINWDTSSESIISKFQVVHHNLGYRFVQSSPKEGVPLRHLFWAT